jgi:hypothetical protein
VAGEHLPERVHRADKTEEIDWWNAAHAQVNNNLLLSPVLDALVSWVKTRAAAHEPGRERREAALLCQA